MDFTIFQAINGLAGRWDWLDGTGKFIGGDYFLYLFILAAGLLWFVPVLKNRVYLMAASILIGRGIVTEGLKRLVSRARPYEILNVHQLLIDNDPGVSFPSGHTTIYFALAFAFHGTRFFWPFFVLAVLGSVSRIFVGVHFPFDVLAGAIIGSLSSLIFLRLFKNRVSG